jgi:hypothetical protein
LNDAPLTECLPVTNYPGADGAIFDNTAAVYVEKLNRIYILGGMTITEGFSRYLDKIWYIDLPSPSTPVPVFDCSNSPHGSYPHPTDCTSFFICTDGELVGKFTCLPPTLFDPIQQRCGNPEKVLCFFSCDGQAGRHPHPGDSSKFIVCGQRSSAFLVHDCPHTLRFDPVLLTCELPPLIGELLRIAISFNRILEIGRDYFFP